MRIDCCHCGPRGHEEFVYLGDASHRHAEIAASGGVDAELSAWGEAVHLRDNPAGPIRELWQHVGGCRAWLVVTRDTRTHEILSVEPARSVALAAAFGGVSATGPVDRTPGDLIKADRTQGGA